MAQRKNPTIESAGIGAMVRMAQREDPTPESLAGLGVMATDGSVQGSNP